MEKRVSRCTILFWLFVGFMVIQLWIEAASAEGMHHHKRGFRKRELACRKECDGGHVAGGRRGLRQGGPAARDDVEDAVDEEEGGAWDNVNVIDGGESEAAKRPISPCVAQCISPYCYGLEYNRPLEYGEVDERYDFFRKCVTLESAEARNKRTQRYATDDDDEE